MKFRCQIPREWRGVALACLLGASLCVSTPVRAQTAAAPAAPASSPAACPAAQAVTHTELFGLWRAEFEGLWQGATLLIEQHPRYAQSLAGAINRNGTRGQIVGDIENGELTLEESADGQRISATWLGDVVAGSCGREIRGTWKAEGEEKGRGFVLRRLP
ncbi:hypothetical protein [Ramlibacter sp.]|uniref:hypothetical protein n=1 Tax=Ramlibacter sp. TaxID=1917967 RepID=UPI0035B324DF